MVLEDSEYARLQSRCASLEDGPDYRCNNYIENLLNTVLDFQMKSPVVEKATRYFFNTHGIETHDKLKQLINGFPDTKEGYLALAKRLWNYSFWTRDKFLRRIIECFDERGIRDQESLEEWVREADFERDAKGQFRTSEHSIGYTLFKWLQLRIGIDTIKPDVHILRFVADSIGRPISQDEAVSALTRIAKETNRKAYRLDAAIWTYQRKLGA